MALLQVWITIQFKYRLLWPVGYTRKVFHVFVFSSSAIIQTYGTLSVLCIYGTWVSLAVWWAIYKADGHKFYECLARPKDSPHRTRFVIQPWLATLAGGLGAQYFFGSCALAGLWVVGLADAAAEPVGTKWGRHPYSLDFIPWLKNSKRTWEGSAAVGIFTLAIFYFLGMAPWTTLCGGVIFITLIEAFSPHGLDNLTLQLAASAYLFLVQQSHTSQF